MEIRDASDLVLAHEWALRRHQDWKQRSAVADKVQSGEWQALWRDVAPNDPDPLVENIYLQALEDKASAAASLSPAIHVAPSSGTRLDRAEANAQKKRKVFVSYGQRSELEKLSEEWYFDWFQHGAAYGVPWVDWGDDVRFPYVIRHNPRHAFPLAHDSRNELTSIFFTKQRRLIDIRQEWGEDHEALARLAEYRAKSDIAEDEAVEEVWYYDTGKWGVALYQNSPDSKTGWRYRNPAAAGSSTGEAYWLAPLEKHLMTRCPVVENKRTTPDGEYRGALDAVIPGLKVAQQLMSAVLDDVAQQIGAPIVMENVVNPEDWGPNAVLEGDGNGPANVEAVRMPVNFEANSHIQSLIEQARRMGKHPQQRSGEAGASIISAKGSNALMGSFNSEMAQAQRDSARMTQNVLSRVAEFDAKWCSGKKAIMGFDEGEAFEERYDPATLFAGDDYRVKVSFGGGLGMEMQNYMVQIATMRNMDAMSRRRFMQLTSLVENPLQEEREIALEQISDGFLTFVMSQAEQGNMQPLVQLSEKIDGDEESARAAIMATIKETFAVPAGGNTQSGPPGGQLGNIDSLLQQRSLEAGGIPGQAEGMPEPPGVGAALRKMLPSNVARAQGSVTEGVPV